MLHVANIWIGVLHLVHPIRGRDGYCSVTEALMSSVSLFAVRHLMPVRCVHLCRLAHIPE